MTNIKSKKIFTNDFEDSTGEFRQIFSENLIAPIIGLLEKIKLPKIYFKIPKRYIYTLSKGVSWILYNEYKKEMLKSTEQIMKEVIQKKYRNRPDSYHNWVIEEIVFQNSICMTEFFLDIMLMLPYFKLYNDYDRFFKIYGIKHLNNALKKGKGAIIVSGHYGNYILSWCFLALKGYKINLIMEYATFKSIIKRMIKDTGVKLIPMPRPDNEKIKPRIKEKLVNALKRNEIIVIMHDAGIKHHYLINLFDIPCHSPIGAAYYGLKYHAPIIPVTIKSDPMKHLHKIIFHPEFKLVNIDKNNEFRAVLHNTYRLNKYFEKKIKQNFVHWNNLIIFERRKMYKRSKKFITGSIIDSIIDEFQYFLDYLAFSYEPDREDNKIFNIISEALFEFKKIKNNQLSIFTSINKELYNNSELIKLLNNT